MCHCSPSIGVCICPAAIPSTPPTLVMLESSNLYACRGKKITCPGARDKLNFKQDKHIFSPNVRRTSKKFSASLFDNIFLDKLIDYRTSKNLTYIAWGTSENFKIFFYPWHDTKLLATYLKFFSDFQFLNYLSTSFKLLMLDSRIEKHVCMVPLSIVIMERHLNFFSSIYYFDIIMIIQISVILPKNVISL